VKGPFGSSGLAVNSTVVPDTESAVCCRGWNACAGAEHITPGASFPAVLSGYGGDSAEWRHFQSALRGISVSHADVFCTGDSSCYNVSNIRTNGGTVYCLGEQSCAFSQIYGAEEVICGGQNACLMTTIDSESDVKVYALAYEAAAGIEIVCDDDDSTGYLYCGGFGSCTAATMQCLRREQCSFDCRGEEAYIDAYCPVIIAADDTSEPTLNPSVDPTTREPSLDPSSSPTIEGMPSPSATSRPTEIIGCGRNVLDAFGVCQVTRTAEDTVFSRMTTCASAKSGNVIRTVYFEDTRCSVKSSVQDSVELPCLADHGCVCSDEVCDYATVKVYTDGNKANSCSGSAYEEFALVRDECVDIAANDDDVDSEVRVAVLCGDASEENRTLSAVSCGSWSSPKYDFTTSWGRTISLKEGKENSLPSCGLSCGTSSDEQNKEELTDAEIAGIVIGSLAGVALIVVLVCLCVRSAKKDESAGQTNSSDEYGVVSQVSDAEQ